MYVYNQDYFGTDDLRPNSKKSSTELSIRTRWLFAGVATLCAWFAISPSFERRSGLGLDFTEVSNEVMLSLEDTPHRFEFFSKQEAEGLCPGPRCPLNLELPAGELSHERKITGSLSTMTTTDGWRKVMYMRWDTVVPGFVKQEGEKVAFDFYGVSGKSWRFFVNGKLIANGFGGTDLPHVVFDAPGSSKSPMTLGFEVDVGRSLAPGIVHIAQIFLCPPEAAGKFRQAYRTLDHMSVLPSATGFALMAMLAGLGCFFTPFYREILAFSIFVTAFNWRLLMVNDMVPFPAWLNVDFVTTDAILRCTLFGTMWAFWGLYFRVTSKLKLTPVAFYASLALAWYGVGRTGIGTAGLVWFVKNIEIHQVAVFGGASILGLRTWHATRKMPWAKFRNVTSLIISLFALLICASFITKLVVSSDGLSWQVYRAYEPLYFFANYSVRGFILGVGMVIALEWALIVRDRQTVLQRFGTVVDPRLMNEIIRGEDAGSKRLDHVVVLFVDLRAFTKICDLYNPDRVTVALNSYLDAVTRSVQMHNGVIDKFVGDAVLATWGVPEKGSSDAVNALRAALSIRLALEDLNQRRLAVGEFPLQFGIGIHMGRAIFGPMGNGTRVDHTVIGPAVNIASRVQDLTKRFGFDILISKEFYQEVTSECLVENLGSVEVRGMSRHLELFKVIGAYMSPGQFVIGDKTLEATIPERSPGVIKNTPNNLTAFDHDKHEQDEKAA